MNGLIVGTTDNIYIYGTRSIDPNFNTYAN